MAAEEERSVKRQHVSTLDDFKNVCETYKFPNNEGGCYVNIVHPSDRSKSAKIVAEQLRLMSIIAFLHNISNMKSAQIATSNISVVCTAKSPQKKKTFCGCRSHKESGTSHEHEKKLYRLTTVVTFTQDDMINFIYKFYGTTDLCVLERVIIPAIMDIGAADVETCLHARILSSLKFETVTRASSLLPKDLFHGYAYTFDILEYAKSHLQEIRSVFKNPKNYLHKVNQIIQCNIGFRLLNFTPALLSIDVDDRNELIEQYSVLTIFKKIK